MTLEAALQDVIALVEGLTPPADALPTDFAPTAYHYVNSPKGFTSTDVDDRAFEFIGFDRGALLETSTNSTRAEYLVPLQLYLRNNGLTRLEQLTRPAKELRAICRAVEARQSWSPGVQAVITEDASVFGASSGEAGDDDFPETDVIVQVSLRFTIIEE